ncbi:LuxR C-terminal-related transcriptional regulator [Georgenia alba]|uniref:LuxR C-terminal-related transcriptional regulator n=1 Tax=Georgenia alba TaxID=2233858 RepID=A0ABW2Q7A7_9MICO
MTAHDELREEALSYLRAGTSVSLRGLPGSGRSSILRAAAQELAATGWTLVELEGVPGLADRPLEALAVADLVTPNANRPRGAVASAVDALRRTLGTGRAVVVVDDSDALDAASIGAVAAAIGSRRVPLLSAASTARRPAELTLPALIRPGVRLVVPPLAYEDTQEIMQGICGGPVHTSAVAVVQARAGGLPGLVHAITDNAHRHGMLTRRGGVWVTAGEVWTAHLARAVEPFLQGLSLPALDGLIKLAHVGAVDVGVARRLVPWEHLEELDDRGLLSFVTTAGNVVVGVYPPLLADHLRRERMGARRLRLLGEISEQLDGEGAAFAPGPLSVADDERTLAARRPRAPEDEDTESRVVADAVLNRLVHDRRSAQVLVRRAEWEQHPDAATAVAFAVTLMVRGDGGEELERVLATAVPAEDQRGRALLAVWRAVHLAYGRGDPAAAVAHLAETAPDVGPWARLVGVVRDRLTLYLTGVTDRGEDVTGDGARALDPLVADEEHLLRAERALAAGRATDALEELELLGGGDPDTEEQASVARGIALVLAGDLEGALAWSGGRYDAGRSRFDANLIIGHGYVVALAHLFRGDDDALREHLGPLLSVGTTPLLYSQHQLGTLVLATRLAARGGRPLTARSLSDQAAEMGLPYGPFPLMAAAQGAAHADLAEGAGADGVADRLWELADRLRERGYLAGAVVAGTRAVELVPDPARSRVLSELAASTDAALLTWLARYAAELSDGDASSRLTAGADLVEAGLTGFGLTLQVQAVRALEQTDPERAAEEGRRLRLVAERLGGSYRALVEPVMPRPVLTAREREVAELAGQGLANGEIARRLVVSVRTVENHLHRAFQKLGVTGRGDLAEALTHD